MNRYDRTLVHLRMRTLVLVSVLSLVIAVIPLPLASGAYTGQARDPMLLGKILTDRALWGKSFSPVLAYLWSWARVDERRVAIFPNRVVGTARYPTPDAAGAQVSELAAALRGPKPKLKPDFAAFFQASIDQPPPFEAMPIALLEDDSFHVAWVSGELELIAPGLTVEAVRDLLGPPEKVSREMVPTEKDRRPVILTLYQYAGGAVTFAESDTAPRLGVVDRVFLDVRAVTAAVFEVR